MFSWYKKAKICLAYLEDVNSGPDNEDSFKRTVWFARSWTLQELIAPEHTDFFDGEWTHIGSKASSASLITEMIGIPPSVLQEECNISAISIAKRMSWAANRTSTRSEEMAYSLMGIFDVNMPLLYGEGRKAFTRLQEEIMRRSADTTISLWGRGDSTSRLLASSPAKFPKLDVEDLWRHSVGPFTPFNLSNVGFEIEAHLVRWKPNTYGLVLASDNSRIYALLLRKYYPFETLYRIELGEWYSLPLSHNVARKVTVLRDIGKQMLESEMERD